MFNRKIRTKLPELSETSKPETESVRDRDAEKKEIGKTYSDEKRRASESNILVGDEVLLKQRHQNKFSTTFESTPFQVIEKNGNQLVIQSPDKSRVLKRNIIHTRPYVREKTDVPVPVEKSSEKIIPDISEATPSATTPEVAVRRSTRTHNPPEHLKDYVCGK